MENPKSESISNGSSVDFHVDELLGAIVGSFWEFHVDLCEKLFKLVILMSDIRNIYADHVVFDCFETVLIRVLL